MRRKIIILNLFLGVALLLSGCQAENKLNAKECLEQGDFFEESQQYDQAIKSYTLALEINANNA